MAQAPLRPPFQSVLFGSQDAVRTPPPAEPAHFHDLNLDRIVEDVIASRQRYDLAGFFHQPLSDPDTLAWRHEIFHDLEKPPVAGAIRAFGEEMRAVQAALTQAGKFFYPGQRASWILAAAARYGAAATALGEALDAVELASRGLLAFRGWLKGYLAGAHFGALVAQTASVQSGLDGVHYALLIRGDNIKVCKYEGERDYSLDVGMTFAKFQQGQVKEYTRKFPDFIDMNHIEAGILDRVAKLFPEEFAALERFCHDWAEFRDPVLTRFEREIQFYLAYLDHIAPLRQAGLSFCYPVLSDSDKAISVSDCFDLALAGKLAGSKRPVIPNDVRLDGQERVFVVSGPNQGGKTTFARMFGQMHYLAALGCPVPGRDARLFLFDQIYTHFEREESITSERSKLEDDLYRIHEILRQATPRSIIIVNEIFTSTTLNDAIELGQKVMAQIIARDALCVCVTFIDELSRQGPKVVSLVSTIVPEDPARRTFKVVRRLADGQAFAVILAEHYGLTARQITQRIGA